MTVSPSGLKIDVTPDPYLVNGSVPVREKRVTLCRCGASGNKPLCDRTHKEIAFEGIT